MGLICLVCSSGRHFSPSLPGDRCLRLGSKNYLQGEIPGSIVWYNALERRPEVLHSISSFDCNFDNPVLWLLHLGKRKRTETEVLTTLIGKLCERTKDILSFYFNQEYISTNHYEDFQIIIRLSKPEMRFQSTTETYEREHSRSKNARRQRKGITNFDDGLWRENDQKKYNSGMQWSVLRAEFERE